MSEVAEADGRFGRSAAAGEHGRHQPAERISMAEQQWRVVLERDGETGEWAAWCPELPGCTSAGVTRQDALDGIREAIALYLQPDPLTLSADAEIAAVVV